MPEPRWLRLLGPLLAAVLVGTGCATIPHGGAVQVTRDIGPVDGLDEPDIRVLPPAPFPSEPQDALVRGFLDAAANADDNHASARRYLTPAASEAWNPDSQVVVYDQGSLSVDIAGDGQVVLRTTLVGRIDSAGAFAPAQGPLAVRITLRKVNGEWRIAKPPGTLLLSSADVARSYRSADIYFLDPAQSVLVADPAFLAVPQRGLATAMVRRLLDGPSAWLAPAVVSAVPPGTQLLGTVPISNGVADVDLSAAVLRASPSARRALSAQIVGTLRQLSEVTAVRIEADGTPLTVPGVGDRQSRDAWLSYDPAYGSDGTVVYRVSGGRLMAGDRPVPGVLGQPGQTFMHPAVSHDRRLVAVLRDVPGGVQLLIGSYGGTPRVALRGRAMTPPTFDLAGRAWTVVTGWDGARYLAVVPSKGPPVVADAPGLSSWGTVRTLRLSPDGAKVAIVGTDRTGGRLLVARVHGRGDRPTVDGERVLLPGSSGVSDVAWMASDRLVTLTSAGSRPGRVPLEVGVDGSDPAPVPVAGVTGEVRQVAAAPGAPLVVAAAGRVWTVSGGMSEPLGDGTDPAYAG